MVNILVVNCSQIFCTFAVETTLLGSKVILLRLWIALKFFVLLQSKQLHSRLRETSLWLWIALKFFVLLQSKQPYSLKIKLEFVVNCSQIFCTFAVETTNSLFGITCVPLWIALKFFVLLQSKQRVRLLPCGCVSCELLSNFLYFCSRNNENPLNNPCFIVVNCSQIFCTFAVETTDLNASIVVVLLWIALKFFVLLQSKQLIEV